VVLFVLVAKVCPGTMELLGRVERVRVVYVWGREGPIVGDMLEIEVVGNVLL